LLSVGCLRIFRQIFIELIECVLPFLLADIHIGEGEPGSHKARIDGKCFVEADLGVSIGMSPIKKYPSR
jgi:hypothetical protein